MVFELDPELIAKSFGDESAHYEAVEPESQPFDSWFDYPVLATRSDEMLDLLREHGAHFDFELDPYDVEMYFEELNDKRFWPVLESSLDKVEVTKMMLSDAAHYGWQAGVEKMVARGVTIDWSEAEEMGLEPHSVASLRTAGLLTSPPATLAQFVMAGDAAAIDALELEPAEIAPQLLSNAIYARSDKVASMLVRKGAKPAAQASDLPTLAVRFGLVETVGAFIDAGRDIDGPGEEGTLLQNAVGWDQVEVVEELLRRGSDVSRVVVRASNPEIMRALFDAGARPDPAAVLDAVAKGYAPGAALDVVSESVELAFSTQQLRAALNEAASNGRADALRAICRFADPNLASAGSLVTLSAPPLYVAAKTRHADAVRALLDCGADASRTAADNKTAYHVAPLGIRQLIREHVAS